MPFTIVSPLEKNYSNFRMKIFLLFQLFKNTAVVHKTLSGPVIVLRPKKGV